MKKLFHRRVYAVFLTLALTMLSVAPCAAFAGESPSGGGEGRVTACDLLVAHCD